MKESVMLVDENDRCQGTMDKMAAHRLGSLHRALSIFIFNNKGELLLQQRAVDKYHSGGKWSNTCCSHPKLGETVKDAAGRRLMEEMGMHCRLEFGFSFTYRAELDKGITEHEFDHVFFGRSDDLPDINPEEVAAYRYINIEELKFELENDPGSYSFWLKSCMPKVAQAYLKILDHEQLVG